MNRAFYKICTFIILLSLSMGAQAKRFASQYCEFELPPGWECSLEGTEWVCQSVTKDRQKESIIILAAKIRGASDSIDQYQGYLKRNKTFVLPGGKTQVSEPTFVKLKTLNQHRWVDAMHLASEVPGFYTRYLATVKEDLGVVVSFSVAKDHYASYQKVFDRVVATLRVFRQKGKVVDFKGVKGKETDLLGDTTFIPDEMAQGDIGVQRKKGSSGAGSTTDMILLAVGAAVVGFVLVKMKKGKKKKGKKKSKK